MSTGDAMRFRPARRVTALRRIARYPVVLVVFATLALVGAAPAGAYQPVNIVYTERVTAGPYEVTVGFFTWPLRAMQSLDYAFLPAGGIAGKSDMLQVSGPGLKTVRARPLVRHSRKRDSWGRTSRRSTRPEVTGSPSGSTVRRGAVRERSTACGYSSSPARRSD